MQSTSTRPLLGYLRRTLGVRAAESTSDQYLLKQFSSHGDEAAFGLLVHRYNRLVIAACARVLGQSADVEDAAQGTFIVLARKAASIRHPEQLGNWLYGVARRVASKAKMQSARRRAHENEVACQSTPEPITHLLGEELRSVLDQEIVRLPIQYRAPFLLCCVGGCTSKEAASQLACPEGTVVSRLAWARERLRVRLTRRGITLGAATAALAGTETSVVAGYSPGVLSGLARFAIESASSPAATSLVVSGKAKLLADQVISSLTLTRFMRAAAVFMSACLLGTGAYAIFGTGNADDETNDGQPQLVASKLVMGLAICLDRPVCQ